MNANSSKTIWLLLLPFIFFSKINNAKVIHRQINIPCTSTLSIEEDTLNRLWEAFLRLDETDWMSVSFNTSKLPEGDRFLTSRKIAKQIILHFRSLGITNEGIRLQYSPEARISMYRSPTHNAYTSKINDKALADQAFSFPNASGFLCRLSSGHKVFIPPSAFDANLQSVVTLTIKEAITKQDFLLAGLTANSERRILSSNGMFHFTAEAEGEQVKLRKSKALVLILSAEHLQDKENLEHYLTFKGEVKAGKMNWVPSYKEKAAVKKANFFKEPEENKTSANLNQNEPIKEVMEVEFFEDTVWFENEYGSMEYIEVLSGTYETPPVSLALLAEETDSGDVQMKVSQLGWINCDRFYECEKKASLLVKLDGPALEPEQVQVYAIFKTIKSILPGQLPFSKTSYVKFNQLPEGEEILLVALFHHNEEIKLAYKTLEIKDQAVVALSFINYSKAQYTALINDLLPN